MSRRDATGLVPNQPPVSRILAIADSLALELRRLKALIEQHKLIVDQGIRVTAEVRKRLAAGSISLGEAASAMHAVHGQLEEFPPNGAASPLTPPHEGVDSPLIPPHVARPRVSGPLPAVPGSALPVQPLPQTQTQTGTEQVAEQFVLHGQLEELPRQEAELVARPQVPGTLPAVPGFAVPASAVPASAVPVQPLPQWTGTEQVVVQCVLPRHEPTIRAYQPFMQMPMQIPHVGAAPGYLLGAAVTSPVSIPGLEQQPRMQQMVLLVPSVHANVSTEAAEAPPWQMSHHHGS